MNIVTILSATPIITTILTKLSPVFGLLSYCTFALIISSCFVSFEILPPLIIFPSLSVVSPSDELFIFFPVVLSSPVVLFSSPLVVLFSPVVLFSSPLVVLFSSGVLLSLSLEVSLSDSVNSHIIIINSQKYALSLTTIVFSIIIRTIIDI